MACNLLENKVSYGQSLHFSKSIINQSMQPEVFNRHFLMTINILKKTLLITSWFLANNLCPLVAKQLSKDLDKNCSLNRGIMCLISGQGWEGRHFI